MNDTIEEFVADLANASVGESALNQYAGCKPQASEDLASAIRRENLRVYLRAMSFSQTRSLLVGEAPGYRGCRLTGIPFTSEAIILDEGIWPFGYATGFRKTAERATITKEATATMVWSALVDTRPPPLMWNAFPFHPFRAGNPESNRKPNRAELLLGAIFLVRLMDLFKITIVGAVGVSAARGLQIAGTPTTFILRHPSHGGKSAFEEGLARLLSLEPADLQGKPEHRIV